MKKIIALLTLGSAVFFSGCGAAGVVPLMSTPSYHEQEIPPEYDLRTHEGQKILVLVEQPAWLDVPVNLRYYLTKAIRKELVLKFEIPVEQVVDYSELSEYRSNNSDFWQLSPVEVGQQLQAELVLVVVIEDFKLREISESGWYEALLQTRVALYDTTSNKKLWPEAAENKLVKVGFEAEQRGLEVAVTRLVMASAHCTVRYLYNCPKKRFRIAEDRSSVGWEKWDSIGGLEQ